MKNSKIRNEQLKKEITKLFKTFVKLFDDCISRNEYYSCKNISRITGELFRDLIKECNNMKIEGKHEIVDFLFKKIIIYNYYQISNSKN